MPWSSTSRDRVMGVLGLPVTIYYVQQVQDALDHVQVHGGDTAVTRIESYLTQHAELETALRTSASRGGLIKVDTIEWSPGGTTSGYKAEMGRIRQQIAKALLLSHLAGSGVRLTRGRLCL